MKIGLYGAIANASYVTARALNNQGLNIIYIRDYLDMFPFSQPIWEDIEFTLSYDSVLRSWTMDEWKERESLYHWRMPSWVKEPSVNVRGIFDNDRKDIKWIFKKILEKAYIKKQPHRAGVIALMRECDILYACGIEAEILAWVSDVPYVIWPHGGDIRMAAGLAPFKGKGLRERISYWILRFFLGASFKDSLWIGTHDPKGIGGNIGKIPYSLEYFPLPLLDRPIPLSKKSKQSSLASLYESLHMTFPSAEYYIFVPSRMDFYWKGTDRLLRAVARLQEKEKFHFIFAGWGQDYQSAKNMIDPDIASFLPCSLSKPLVFRFFQSVDLVVDQFLFGSYGAAAIEAMSCGTPVMMSIDNESFYTRGWEPPPVLNAQIEEDILAVLQNILNGHINLEKEGLKAREWFHRTHSEKVAINCFLTKLETVA